MKQQQKMYIIYSNVAVFGFSLRTIKQPHHQHGASSSSSSAAALFINYIHNMMRQQRQQSKHPILKSLQSQFPQFSLSEIRDVIYRSNGHGGIAARRLRERVLRNRYQSLERSVITIQRKFRSYKLRNEMPAFPTLYGLGRTIDFSVLFERAKQILRSTSSQHQNECALRIQCRVRVFISKLRLYEQRRLIRSIELQRFVRGFLARIKFTEEKERRERRNRHEFSKKIQALWRGTKGRSHALHLYRNICARRVQNQARVYLAKRVRNELKRVKACILIQTQSKAYIFRLQIQRLVKRRRATILIQSYERGRRARKCARTERQKRAEMVRIQCLIRAFRDISTLRSMRRVQAVITIQRYERRRVAMSILRAHREKIAATKIASTWRGTLARRLYRREILISRPMWQIGFDESMRSRYRPVQRNVLGRVRNLLKVHRALDEKLKSTVKIQRQVRVWLKRRRRDAVVIQRVFRGYRAKMLRHRRRDAGKSIRNWARDIITRSKESQGWKRLQAVFRGRYIRATRREASHKIGRYVLKRWRKSRRCFETVDSVQWYVSPWGERTMLQFVHDDNNNNNNNKKEQVIQKSPLLEKVRSILHMIGVRGTKSITQQDNDFNQQQKQQEQWDVFTYVDPWNQSHQLQFRYLKHRLVTRIQANVRGILTRLRIVRSVENSVIKLQAAIRGHLVRVRLFHFVCRIQAVWRGLQTRKRLILIRDRVWILGETKVRVRNHDILTKLPMSRWCEVFGENEIITKKTREQYIRWIGVKGTLRNYDPTDRSFEICNVSSTDYMPEILGGRWWPEETLEECY